MPGIDFWYEFASTYSYPAAMRVESLAQRTRAWRCAGGRSCSGRCSPNRAGAIRRSTSIPSRAAICGATWSGSANRSDCRFAAPSRSRKTRCSRRASRWRFAEGIRPPFSRAVYAAEFGEGRAIADRGAALQARRRFGRGRRSGPGARGIAGKQGGAAGRLAKRPRRSACPARRAASSAGTKYSGATTGSPKRSIGRRAADVFSGSHAVAAPLYRRSGQLTRGRRHDSHA